MNPASLQVNYYHAAYQLLPSFQPTCLSKAAEGGSALPRPAAGAAEMPLLSPKDITNESFERGSVAAEALPCAARLLSSPPSMPRLLLL